MGVGKEEDDFPASYEGEKEPTLPYGSPIPEKKKRK
jgi:hypothetical protein